MNNNKRDYNYGRCHVCGEQMQEKRINQDFWVKGKLVVIESVPAGVCPQCGEKIVKADVGRELAGPFRDPDGARGRGNLRRSVSLRRAPLPE